MAEENTDVVLEAARRFEAGDLDGMAKYRRLQGKIAEVRFFWDWDQTLEAARARLSGDA